MDFTGLKQSADYVRSELLTGLAALADECANYVRGELLTGLALLEDAKGSFTGTAIDYRLPCTAAEDRTCQIVGQLSTWNEFLCKVHLELRETPGTRSQLSLSTCLGTGRIHFEGEELYQAVTLAYWLLRMHQCVASIDIPGRYSFMLSTVLSSALQDSSSVRCLTFRSLYTGCPDNVSEVLPSLTKLEAFECVGEFSVPQAPLTAALVLLLQKTASLTCLRIPTLPWTDGRDACKFLSALEANSTLQELSFHDSLVEKASCASGQQFEDCMKNNKTLTTLTVVASDKPLQNYTCELLIGIMANKTLSKVNLVGFRMDALNPTILSLVLKQNKALRSFNVIRAQFGHDVAESPDLFDLFTETETLEEVTLPMHIWNKEQWQLFFCVLVNKRNLSCVTIELDAPSYSVSYSVIFEVYASLEESGAAEKVLFKYASLPREPPYSPVTFPSKGFSELYIGTVHEASRECLLTVIRQLPSYTNITSVNLDVRRSDWDDALSSAFSTYVESTTTLRKLRVTSLESYAGLEPDAMTKRFCMLLVRSLGQNTSVRELFVEMCADKEVAKDLVDVIKTSQNIRRVHLRAHEHDVAVAFIRRLSIGISDNYRLTHVTLDYRLSTISEEGWFAIRSVAARNSSLVTRAAQYVCGAACDRYRAQALEKVSRSHSLMEEVAELASISNSEAMSRVRKGLRSFEGLHDFMRLCGVVREKVTCHARQDGCKQLDELNVRCWSRVRSYLLVEDIKM